MTYAIPQITRPFEIEINLPGSKSIALRQLAMSALTSEATVLSGVPECDDADAMIGALQALGVGIDQDGDHLRLTVSKEPIYGVVVVLVTKTGGLIHNRIRSFNHGTMTKNLRFSR